MLTIFDDIDPDASFGEAVSEGVGVALGFVSVCWEPAPQGVFESDKAADVARALTAFIVERATKLTEEPS